MAEGAKQIKEVKGLIYTTEYEFHPGRILIEGDRIAGVDFCTEGELSEAERETLVLPGLVDVHFHGAAGYDFCDGNAEAYQAIEAYENSHGITSICPATMTLPVEQLKHILTEVSENKPDRCAEGRICDPSQCGSAERIAEMCEGTGKTGFHRAGDGRSDRLYPGAGERVSFLHSTYHVRL